MRSTGRLVGRSDARSIASSTRSPWLARFVFSPNEIDQWQNRPRPVPCFSQSDDSETRSRNCAKGMLELIEEWPCKAIASPGTGVAAGTPAACMNKPSRARRRNAGA